MMSALCRWYAACDNVTTTALAHPTLGLVPCCERCATRVEDRRDQLVPITDTAALASFIPANVCPCGGTRVDISLRAGLTCADCGRAV